MALDLPTAQRLVAALLNMAVAMLTGAGCARLWLARDASPWAQARRRPVRTAALAAAVAALAASVAWLWLESAAMAEVPVTAAGSAAWTMLSATHVGFACGIGMAALAVATAGVLVRDSGSGRPAQVTLAALAVFWYTRSMVSHAASDGDFSLRLLADAVHVGLISLWVGEVLIAGAIVLTASGDMSPTDRRARAAYVESLSHSATLALAGIGATGIYAASRSVGGWANLFATPYGTTLVAKVLVVGLAAALGGFNRFRVMPPWLAHESTGHAAPEVLPARFRHVLRIEGLLLLTAVVLAAWLASMEPPGASM